MFNNNNCSRNVQEICHCYRICQESLSILKVAQRAGWPGAPGCRARQVRVFVVVAVVVVVVVVIVVVVVAVAVVAKGLSHAKFHAIFESRLYNQRAIVPICPFFFIKYLSPFGRSQLSKNVVFWSTMLSTNQPDSLLHSPIH